MNQAIDRPAVPLRAASAALVALFVMNLLNYIDRYVLSAVIEPVQQAIGLKDNDAQTGFLLNAFFISYTLFSPIVGWLGDRVTRKKLLAAGVAVWSIATFGSGMATSFGQMLLARSVLGIGEATYATIAPTLISDLFRRERRGVAMAIFYVAIPVGSALGYLIGGQIGAAFGWQWAFYVVGLPGLIVAVGALAIHEPPRGASEDVGDAALAQHSALPVTWDTYASLARCPSYVFNTLGMAMMTFALGGLAQWAPKFLSVNRGFGLRDANNWLGAVIVVSGFVGTALGGWLGEVLRPRIRGAYFWLCGFAMITAAPFVLVAITARRPGVIFPCLGAGMTLLFLSTGPSNTIIVNVTVPKIRAAAMAVNIFLIHLLGDIPSPPLMGWVADLTRDRFWGMAMTLPALVASGVLYCLGARHLEGDQEAVVRELQFGTRRGG